MDSLFWFCVGVGFGLAWSLRTLTTKQPRRYPPGAERGFWVEGGSGPLWFESPHGRTVADWERGE